MSSNLDLWNSQKTTDLKYTKKANNGRFSFTCIDPQYQLLKATQQWGPYGDRWGLKHISYKVIDIGGGASAIMESTFFYPTADGVTAEFPMIVDLKFRPGDDCFKKLMTTTRSKALSFLGFGADVFMGKFEDDAYLRALSANKADPDGFMQTLIERIGECKTGRELSQKRQKLDEMLQDGIITQEQFDAAKEACTTRRNKFGN